ncbi:hypothetical protein Tco_0671661 [Tanacetum coccineum]
MEKKSIHIIREKRDEMGREKVNTGRQLISKIDWLLSSEVLFEGRPIMSICSQAMNGWICYIKSMLKESKHLGISKEVGTLRYLSLLIPLTKVGDETVHKKLGNRMERVATTASSLEAEQDSGGYTSGSDEDSKKLNELTELCTKLSEKVTSLEQDLKQTKQVYGKALTKLVKKVKHLEDQLKSRTKRRKAKVTILDEEDDLVSEDPSKQGRMSETEYEDVETKHAEEVEYGDILEQITPSKDAS